MMTLRKAGHRSRQTACREFWLVLAVSSVCVFASSAGALTIGLTYDETQSQPPSFDPDGTRLGTIMAAAAAQWEDIIEDNWSLDLAYTWGDLGNDGVRGVAAVLDTRAGKPTTARVRFDTGDADIEHTWYFDPTPNDHDEYELPQVLFRDLSEAERAAWYRGSPPGVLEVSFAGLAARSAPIAARDGFDLLSVVMHEIGHTLGLSEVVGGTEAADLDFDVNSELIGGSSTAILASNDGDRAHLAAARTLMFPSFVTGIRRLPSQTDVLAVASAADWRNIDLPRKDLLRGPSWSLAENWLGNRLPDQDDDVFLRSGEIVTLDVPTTIQSLMVGEQTVLRTAGFRLDATDSISIDGQLDLSGGTYVAPEFVQAGTLNVADSPSSPLIRANSRFRGGSTTRLESDLVLAGSAIIESEASFEGPGQLVLTEGTDLGLEDKTVLSVGLVNHGLFRTVPSPGSVTLTSYRQTGSGTLAVTVAGGRPGNAQLRVLGTAEFAGAMVVDLEREFSIPSGSVDTVTILTASEIRGQFDTEPTRHRGNGLFADVLYEESSVVLQLHQALPGDANGDRRVDQVDIVQVLTAGKYLTGQPVDWTEGDWSQGPNGGDGRFDQLDLIAALRARGNLNDTRSAGRVAAAKTADPTIVQKAPGNRFLGERQISINHPHPALSLATPAARGKERVPSNLPLALIEGSDVASDSSIDLVFLAAGRHFAPGAGNLAFASDAGRLDQVIEPVVNNSVDWLPTSSTASNLGAEDLVGGDLIQLRFAHAGTGIDPLDRLAKPVAEPSALALLMIGALVILIDRARARARHHRMLADGTPGPMPACWRSVQG